MLGSPTPTDVSKKGHLFGYNWEVQDKCCPQVSNNLNRTQFVSCSYGVGSTPSLPVTSHTSCSLLSCSCALSCDLKTGAKKKKKTGAITPPPLHLPHSRWQREKPIFLITSAESHSNWTSLGHMTIPELSTAPKISALIGKAWVTCSIPGTNLL